MTTALATLGSKLAERFNMGDNGTEVISVLKATAFKGPATDAQLTALLIVAQQYGLNPFTKELFAFPDKNNGIVPVVGVDGWSRIINEHPQFDGLEFKQDDESCTCTIYRKDRGHPISVTEYMSECKRAIGPWLSHPKRLLRHKALIQCARLAFGYTGIYDQDEAERIIESDVVQLRVVDTATGEVTRPELPPYPDNKLDVNLPAWALAIKEGKKTSSEIIAMVRTRGTLTAEQVAKIEALGAQAAADATLDGEFEEVNEPGEPGANG